MTDPNPWGFILGATVGGCLTFVGVMKRLRDKRRLRALAGESAGDRVALIAWARARGWIGGDATDPTLAQRAERTLGLCATPGDRDVSVVLVGNNVAGPIVVVESTLVAPRQRGLAPVSDGELLGVDIEFAAAATPSGLYVVADNGLVITQRGGDTGHEIKRALDGLLAGTTLRINADRLLLTHPGSASPRRLEEILRRLSDLAAALSTGAGPYRA